jgi:transposase-like protein
MLEAVKLVALGERSKAKIASELGIRVNQLRNWRLGFEEEERVGAPKRMTVTGDDLGRLWLRIFLHRSTVSLTDVPAINRHNR